MTDDEREISSFEEAYEGRPPWDIGRPQRAIVQAAEEGMIRGNVLDVGCGTGENTLFLAQRGHYVWGVDVVKKVIEQARVEAHERGVDARFFVLDALDLGQLERTFDTIVDSGLFHVFDDEDREHYVEEIGRVLAPGGRYVMLCFSDLEPGDWGPRRISEAEIRATFAQGWGVETIRPTRFETTRDPGFAKAWLTVAVRRAPI